MWKYYTLILTRTTRSHKGQFNKEFEKYYLMEIFSLLKGYFPWTYVNFILAL